MDINFEPQDRMDVFYDNEWWPGELEKPDKKGGWWFKFDSTDPKTGKAAFVLVKSSDLEVMLRRPGGDPNTECGLLPSEQVRNTPLSGGSPPSASTGKKVCQRTGKEVERYDEDGKTLAKYPSLRVCAEELSDELKTSGVDIFVTELDVSRHLNGLSRRGKSKNPPKSDKLSKQGIQLRYAKVDTPVLCAVCANTTDAEVVYCDGKGCENTAVHLETCAALDPETPVDVMGVPVGNYFCPSCRDPASGRMPAGARVPPAGARSQVGLCMVDGDDDSRWFARALYFEGWNWMYALKRLSAKIADEPDEYKMVVEEVMGFDGIYKWETPTTTEAARVQCYETVASYARSQVTFNIFQSR